MSWWIPIAIVGAILLGAALAFSLSLMAGTRRSADEPTSRQASAGVHARAGDAPGTTGSRYEQDNAIVWNPVAFLAVGGLIGALVGLALLIELL